MKRSASILLILILVIPSMVTYLFLSYQKDEIRHEVKERIIEGMNRGELVLLKFTHTQAELELEWEHSKEFEYRGEMYDVVEKELVNDTIYFWCWWDHEETKLNKQLAALTSKGMQNDPQNRSQQQHLLDYFKSLFYTEGPNDWILSKMSLDPVLYWGTDKLTSQSIYPPTPPPRMS